MEARELHRMTVEEYVTYDRRSDVRNEYVDGEVFAMAGGRPEHGIVTRNVVVALTSALRGKPCLAMNEAQKIGTPRTGAYHYPDASVICGPPQRDALDEHAFVNPTVLVEVLSPASADYDRGSKFVHYRSLESLREYVLVDEEARLVEHYALQDDGAWLLREVREGSVPLHSIGVSLVLDDLWEDVDRVKDA